VLRALLETLFAAEDIVPSGIWLRVRMNLLDPSQRSGWKLHLSATPARFEALLRAALPHLHAAGMPFKILATLDEVERMVAGERGLLQTGKCVTIYPRNEADAAALGGCLVDALRGIPGPAVLSDTPFAPDTPVYYRFGPYDARVEIDAMGQERRLLWRPDLDRDVWDSTSGGPNEMPPRVHLPTHAAPDHLDFLRDAYEFTRMLHLSAKGGVFVAHARNVSDATSLLIKTARPHTNSDLHGRDAVWALKREHALLETLRGLPGIPEAGKIIVSEAASAIVRPFVEGTTFWQLWTAPNARLPERQAFLQRVLGDVRAAVAMLHARGIIVRDLAPGNILVTTSGVCLMDLELAHTVDDPAPPYRRGTRGFFDPSLPIGTPPTVCDDEFALQALENMIAPSGSPMIGVSRAEPGQKLDVKATLRNEVARCLGTAASPSSWNVYDGLAGFVLIAEELDVAPDGLGITQEDSDALVESAAVVRHIPGYYFGASGQAVAAARLGCHDDAERIVRQIVERESSVPDICQGVAGLLLACTELHEITRRESFRMFAEQTRERLLDLACDEDGALLWRWPEGPFGDLSGAACLGFGHGLAGVLYALLRADGLAPSARARDQIERGLVTLVRHANVVPGTRDALWWPVSSSDTTCWNAWCHGTPGVIKTLAAAAHAGLADTPVLHAALRGMNLANNSECCLCHGTASRLDAVNDCMSIPGFTLPDALRHAAQSDFETLAAACTPAHFVANGDDDADSAHGLMTGLPGALLTLHRAQAWR